MNLFIAGTGTNVGKTYIACALLHLLSKSQTRLSYYKPISTGGQKSSDVAYVHRYLPRLPGHCSYHFPLPASPHFSASCAGETISLQKLNQDWRQLTKKGSVVVEGVGGLFVPLKLRPLLYLKDLILRWRLPVLLVAQAGLGTLNHTLLSAFYLRREKIPIACILLNQRNRKKNRIQQNNQTTLQSILRIPVFLFPYTPSPLVSLPFEEPLFQALQKAEKRLER